MKLKKRKSLCAQCVNMPAKVSKKVVGMIIRSRKSIMKDGVITVPMTFVKSHSLTPLIIIIISQLSLPLFPVAAPASILDFRAAAKLLPKRFISSPILSSRNVA
ncbi:hypothetical protein ALC57_10896 [Trachymyrmex cornetzi]|uniref:Uncharacterized protein n=1 Tax=Trachymyrmex cornetzi TaxID=471704 RepID=A0A151J3A3_9HYME|nr:hypothetical protein ALC57_10896 [Trachymyrmex cornetzi]